MMEVVVNLTCIKVKTCLFWIKKIAPRWIYIGLTVYMYSYATEGCRFSPDTQLSPIENQTCHNYYEQCIIFYLYVLTQCLTGWQNFRNI